MNSGHRKMAADTTTKADAIRAFDPAENKSQMMRQLSVAFYTAVRVNRGPVQWIHE